MKNSRKWLLPGGSDGDNFMSEIRCYKAYSSYKRSPGRKPDTGSASFKKTGYETGKTIVC